MNDTTEKDREEARKFCETVKVIQQVEINGVKRQDETKYPFNTPENIENMARFITRIRASAADEAARKERERCTTEIAGYRLVIKYAINKDAEDGYTMHPDIAERLSAILTPESASKPASPRDVSAEVETVRDYMLTTRDWYEQGHAEIGDYMPPLESEGDVAFAALLRIEATLKGLT